MDKLYYRNSISALLMDTSECNHLKVNIPLQTSCVEEIWQHETEGIIMMKLRGKEKPVELEEYEDCLPQIYKYLYEHRYDKLSDEELKEIFDDIEADSAIEEYKSGLRE